MSFSEEEREFLSQARLKVRIPANTQGSNPLGRDENDEEVPPSDLEAEERDTLFFDEQLKILVVFEIPQCSESALESLLSRLDIRIDVWAMESQPTIQDGQAAPPMLKDLVFSENITVGNDPLTLVKEDDGVGATVCLVWAEPVVLNRPRSRFTSPVITVIANGTVTPVKSEDTNEYLPSLRPLEENVLQPLAALSVDGRGAPYLPISRLQRVLPTPATEVERFRLQQEPSAAIKIFPALIARMRYTRIKTPTPSPTTIASLDIEVIPFVELKASITQADVSLTSGHAEQLMSAFLPMACQSKDCISLMYKLHQLSPATQQRPPQPPATSNPNVDILNITLSATIRLSPTCQPNIKMSWSTNVDFTQPLNPSFGTPSQPIHRPNRPISLPLNPDPTSSSSITTSLQPASSPLTPLGITITFTSPSTPTKPGVPFSWTVLVVNTSSSPIKLALIPLPRIHRTSTTLHNYTKRHAPKPSLPGGSSSKPRPMSSVSTSSTTGTTPHPHMPGFKHTTTTTPRPTVEDIAPAVLDSTMLYALQQGNTPPHDTDVISLTSEVRIGPLAPGQCHECEVVMVALKTGVHSVDAIRVVNLTPKSGRRGSASGNGNGNGDGEVGSVSGSALGKEKEKGDGGGGGDAASVSAKGQGQGQHVVVDIRDLPDIVCEA